MDILQSCLSALIGGGLALIGVIYSSKKQHNATVMAITTEMQIMKAEYKGDIDLIKKDINELEKKQDKHNSLIERMYAVEKAVEVIEERQKVVNRRVDNLEKAGA